MDYLVPDPAQAIALRALGDGRWRLEAEPTLDLRRTFVDTFDWAVYRAGAALEWHGSPPDLTLVWSDLHEPTHETLQNAPAAPAFHTELPPGPVRDRLSEVTDHRRLLPVMVVTTRLHPFLVRDLDGLALAQVQLAQSRFQDPRGGGGGELRARLRLLPGPGREEQGEAVLAALTERLALTGADAPLLLEALAAAGRQPADYSSKIDHRLDPQARADTVTKEVLRALFATLEANLDGVRANLDCEFLHDLRVAIRRTRSALGEVRGVFPAELVRHFKAEFAWLQGVTGPVRDLDVYLLEFDAYQEALPPALRPDLEPLRGFLRSHYGALQQALVAALASERFARLTADWRAFLAAPVPVADPPPNGARPIKAVADRRIRALAKRVRREGRRIGPADATPEVLHELRKRCKKLRYLMEFFQSLYAREAMRTLIGQLKVLLDNLGGFQDRAVQAAHLRDLARRMRDEDQAPSDTLVAVGAVVGNLMAHQQHARGDLDRAFGAFLDEQQQQHFRSLFAPAPTGHEHRHEHDHQHQ